jgi:hypothetical protein
MSVGGGCATPNGTPLQSHLDGVCNIEKHVGLYLCRACAPALCGVGLFVDLVRVALECGGADCYSFVVDGGGSDRLIGGVVLALDLALKMLEGLRRPMFLSSRLDLVL